MQQPNTTASREVEELADTIKKSFEDYSDGYNDATQLSKAKEDEIREYREVLSIALFALRGVNEAPFIKDAKERIEATLNRE
jgi:hypothetical protein